MNLSPPARIADRDQATAAFRALQQRAQAQGVVLREPPPEPTTCCGRGCNGCVWESYYAAADWWCEEASVQLDENP